MSIITISSIFNDDFNDYEDFCNNSVVANFIDTTTFETTLTTYIYMPIWLRYKDTPIKFSNDEKGQDAFLRNFYNQLSEVVFDFHNYAKENIEYFLYQNDVTKQGKPMSKTITSGIAPINQKIDQEVDKTNLASGTGSQFVSETVYNGVAWHKLVEGYFTPNRKTALLKAFQWLFVSVYSPETRYDDKIEQVRYVQLSFIDDDNNIIDEQKVYPTKSYFTMSEVDIARPENLEPQNIAKDVDIAGIIGTYIGNVIPIVTVQSDLTQDQEITTPSGYSGMDKVIVEKPLTAIAENIKQGVNIGGVVGNYVGVNYLDNRITNASDPYEYTAPNTITDIRTHAFYEDSNITKFTSNAITVGNYAFYHCVSMTELNLPEATTIGNNMCFQCTTLQKANIPKVTGKLPTYVFDYSTSLSILNAPLITSIGTYALANCSNLVNLSFPNITGIIEMRAFESAIRLESVDIGNATQLQAYSFGSCFSLTDIYIHTNSVCALANTYVFYNTTQLITIHVPASLISSYQTATNWSTYYNNNNVTFVAL